MVHLIMNDEKVVSMIFVRRNLYFVHEAPGELYSNFYVIFLHFGVQLPVVVGSCT